MPRGCRRLHANATHQVELIATELEWQRAGATERARKDWAEFEEGTNVENLDPATQCLLEHLVPYLEDPS